jgi:hypothetical protein
VNCAGDPGLLVFLIFFVPHFQTDDCVGGLKSSAQFPRLELGVVSFILLSCCSSGRFLAAKGNERRSFVPS